MKITDIEVERFGVWHDLQLPVPGGGLSVIYGPNEAGKTTLMRFLRGMLYGIDPLRIESADHRGPKAAWSGRLRARHAGRALEIVRRSAAGAHGELSLLTGDSSQHEHESLSAMLGETSERLFQHVFAIGLAELQELATLHDEEVAERIYGLSLGPEGQKLLEVGREIEAERERLLGADGTVGELTSLLARDAELQAAIADAGRALERYTELGNRRRELETEIRDLKNRQADEHRQLRGHLFLERVWEPWKNVRECREELASLPELAGFPERGLERLQELENQLNQVSEARDAALDRAKRLRKQAESVPVDREVQKRAASMRSFLDQRDWLQETLERMAAAEQRAQERKAEFDEQLALLGEGWTVSRLDGVETSASSHYRLTTTARKYRSALRRRGRLKKYLLRVSETCHQRTGEIDERLKELGGQSIDEALVAAREKVADLHELERLKTREADLERRVSGTSHQLEQLESRLALPKWVMALLAGFAVAGIAAAIMGFITGVTSNGIAGLMWALLGATCGGLAWALKTHFQSAVQDGLQQLQAEERDAERRLGEIRESIGRIARRHSSSLLSIFDPAESGGDQPDQSESGFIHHAKQELAELEGLADELQRIRQQRQRLSALRRRLPAIQRDVSTARQNWCELVVQLGLPETVRIDETFRTWEQAAEAIERKRRWDATREDLRTVRQTVQSFRKRLENLGRKLGRSGDDYNQPLSVLDRWEETLRVLARQRAEQRRLRREEQECRSQAAEYQPQIDELTTRRGALLVQGGAASREEFERRAELVRRRHECEELLELANAELDAAEQTQPDLAIVEEDLLNFDPEENAARVADINAGLGEIDAQLQHAFEELGSVKQQMESLESDHRSTSLRYDRAELQSQINRALERWHGLELAAQAVQQIRERYERTCQPETLAAASRYFEQLTRGRHRNIWTPLGERHLCVDDDLERTLRVEELSNGTREQLFLAVRLALVRELAEKGIELPMILDDILVNFDQNRTEAAVDTLIEFAQHGQQILFFTCHLHLAHLFEARGIEPVWLPSHERLLEQRRAG